MATAATATPTPTPTIETLAAEVMTLEAELNALNARRTADQKALDSLNAERGQISEAIARGTVKPEVASALARRLEQTQASIAGFDSLIADLGGKHNAAYRTLARLRAAEAERAQLAAIQALGQEAESIVTRIAETLNTTERGDLARYEEVRKRLWDFAKGHRLGVVPIPLTAQAAEAAMRVADKTIKQKLAPILKAFGR